MCEAVMKSGRSLFAHASRSATSPPAPNSGSSLVSKLAFVLGASGTVEVLDRASRVVMVAVGALFEF